MITDKDIADAYEAALAVPGHLDHKMVGSAYTLSREAANDVDMLVLVEDLEAAVEHAHDCSYEDHDGHVDYDLERSHPVRRGKTNLLLTAGKEWFDGFVRAAEVCKFLQIENRGQRVVIHKIVRDGHVANEYMAPRDPVECDLL